jgi:hypothetical protein
MMAPLSGEISWAACCTIITAALPSVDCLGWLFRTVRGYTLELRMVPIKGIANGICNAEGLRIIVYLLCHIISNGLGAIISPIIHHFWYSFC